MTKKELIQRALLSHKNLKTEFFQTLEPLSIMAWLHPTDRLYLATSGQVDDLVPETQLKNYIFHLKHKLRWMSTD